MDAAAGMIEKAIIANPTYAEAYNNLGIHLHVCPTCASTYHDISCQLPAGVVVGLDLFTESHSVNLYGELLSVIKSV